MKNVITVLMIGLTLAACKSKSTATTSGTETTSVNTGSISAYSPSKAMKAKFAKDFPKATAVSWSKNNLRALVDFVNSSNFRSEAMYGFDGTLMENRVGMDINKLPLDAKSYLNKTYPSNEITHAFKVRQGYNDKYILAKLKNADDVLFDLNGNFINYKPE